MTSFKELAGKLFGKRAEGPALQARIACFREVLQANNAALGHIASIQRALSGEEKVTAAQANRLITAVTIQTYRMIANLNRMTSDGHRALVPQFDRIKEKISKCAQVTPTLQAVGMTVPMARLSAELVDVVGQKSALLGEAQRILGDCVPRGCATTVEAYQAFMNANGLSGRIAQILGDTQTDDVAELFELSARLTSMVENEPVAPSLSDALLGAVSSLGPLSSIRVAVRSSALQEGGLELSFAGQYRSMLNVTGENIVDAFRQVVASKYSPEALTYRMGCGLDDAEVAMCCCVVEMIDAVAAGVLYSAWATPSGPVGLVQAVRGLGLSAVDGSAEPDSYSVSRSTRSVVARKLGQQSRALKCASGEGTESQQVDGSGAQAILSDEQALALCELGWRLEESLHNPVDMEWAIAPDGRLFVLQVRAERSSHADAPIVAPITDAAVLLERGARVSGGAASGKVCRVLTDLDTLRCPTGAVLVLKEANPRFAVLLPRAAAVVADMGEVTGHLATVARELGVPALFATRTASRVLKEGSVATVDADAGVVYDGLVQSAIDRSPSRSGPPRNPSLEALRAVADEIVPLTLRDRLASGCSPKKCQTLHDVIRYCHQATIEAMFDVGDREARRGIEVRRLMSVVPIQCNVLDLGGGLRPGVTEIEVTIDDVVSAPMRALWAGMTDSRLRWNLEKSVSLRGFMSAVVNYNFDHDRRVRGMGEPSYAFITADYVSLNSRIGYHFSTVDARVGDAPECNHLSFRFVGGSTGVEQRSRRAMLLKRLLDAKGFETDCKVDLVNARIRHVPMDVLLEKTKLVGMLIGYANHLDMALVSDEALDDHESAFLRGEFGFKGGFSESK